MFAIPANAATEGMVQDDVTVPSGMDVAFLEMIWDERGQAGLTYRFRFVAPGVRDRSYTDVAADMEHLCTVFAVPRIASIVGPRPNQVIVSLSSEATEFGEPAPDVVQYFEAYRVEDYACIWELF